MRRERRTRFIRYLWWVPKYTMRLRQRLQCLYCTFRYTHTVDPARQYLGNAFLILSDVVLKMIMGE